MRMRIHHRRSDIGRLPTHRRQPFKSVIEPIIVPANARYSGQLLPVARA
jgi:hypothetical protein